MIFALLAAALLVPTVRAETMVDAGVYAAAVSSFERSKGRRSIEPLYAQAKVLSTKLQAVLETLGESDFNALKRKLKSLDLDRDEGVMAEPNVAFFRRLAERRGLKVDRAFFTLKARTRPHFAWPAYVEQQTDYSGCVRYGEALMVLLYGDWLRFARSHPDNYREDAAHETEELVAELVGGTCACGDRETVAMELSHFLEIFPRSPPAEAVRGRLNAVRSGQGGTRFNCKSG